MIQSINCESSVMDIKKITNSIVNLIIKKLVDISGLSF